MIPISQTNKISTNFSTKSQIQNDDINSELGRLLHAAVINKGFREKLLMNPISCIDAGYCGESFHFPSEMKNRIEQIKARTLEEFSGHVIKLINMPTVSEMATLYCN